MKTITKPILDESKFDARLAQLEKSLQWNPRVISRLESFIRTGDDYSLFRVNPLAYAKEKGLEEREGIDLFLYAAIHGIFQMNWNLLCPGCTSVVESFTSLRNLDCHYHCEICNVDFEASLDDYIQISFTVSPDVRPIVFHNPETLADLDSIMKYRFAREGITKIDGAKWIEKTLPLVKFFSVLNPGGKTSFTVRISGGFIIINELLNHLGVGLKVGDLSGKDNAKIGITIGTASIETSDAALSAGERVFEFHNISEKKCLITVMNLPPDYAESFAMEFSPFLSGKRLFTSQTFRDLFHHEIVKGTDSLGVKNIAILFTDLKGSTSLYGRIGDLKAYSLVRQHFDILGGVVASNSGAIVKTIGDAVMASFMNPLQAVKAAMEMRREVEGMNALLGGKDIILKIGIHSGASIVVNLNDRLDYFGQTVNIAARVQHLASANEIFLTSDVYAYPGVKDVISGERVEASMAKVKGVRDELNVYKISSMTRQLSGERMVPNE